MLNAIARIPVEFVWSRKISGEAEKLLKNELYRNLILLDTLDLLNYFTSYLLNYMANINGPSLLH